MLNNKHSLPVLLACAVALASCTREQTAVQPDADAVALEIYVPDGTASGKTWLDASASGDVLPVYWSDGDRVSVNGVVSSAIEVPDGGKIAQATFRARNVYAPYTVVYPSSAFNSLGEDGRIILNVDNVQAYREGSFADGAALLYGYSENDSSPVVLKNLCGAVCVTLKDVARTKITSISISSNGGKAIAGKFTYNPAEDKLEAVQGSSSISMALPQDGLSLTPEGIRFVFSIPAGEYPEGFSIRFDDSLKHILRYSWVRASEDAQPGITLPAGRIVCFPARDYVPGAREICSEQDWNEFASLYNSGSDWQKEWLSADGSVRIGADFTAESLTKLNSFASVIDGCGFTITQPSASGPLFGTLTGTVRNLTLAGAMPSVADPGNSGAVAFVTNLSESGLLENCTNKMDIFVNTNLKTVASAFVRTLSGGTLKGCTNDGAISLRIDVSDQDQPVVAGGIAATVSLTSPAVIDGCINKKPVSVVIVKPASSSRRPVQAGYGGIVGTYVQGSGSNFLTISNCSNEGSISAAYATIPPTTAPALHSSVGGIIGAAMKYNTGGSTMWYNPSSRPASVPSIDCVYMVMKNCTNTASVSNGLVSSCSSDDTYKTYVGGLAGTLNGLANQHILVEDCSTEGTVIPVEHKYSRSALCAIAGGLAGFGAYVDFKGCTVRSDQIGTSRRQNYSAAGGIGYAIGTFLMENCSIFVNIKHIRTTKYTEDNIGLGFNMSTKINTDGGVYNTMRKIDGSVIRNCRFGGVIEYNSSPVEYNAASAPTLDKKETITASTFSDWIVSDSFYKGTDADYSKKITLEGNTYWDGK